MARHVLLPQVEQVGTDDVHAVRLVPGAQADDRHRQGLGQVFADLFGGHLTEDREAACIDEGHGVVDHFLGPVGGLALGEEAAELGHAHRRNADMALHRNTRLDDGLDVFRVVLVALAFHHFRVRFVDEAPGVFDRLFGRDVEAPIGHVDHAQAVLAAPVDGLGHNHDLVEGDGHGALVAEQDHPPGIRHAEDVHAKPVGDHRRAIIVNRHLRDRLSLTHFFLQRADGYLSSPFFTLAHVLSSLYEREDLSSRRYLPW